MGWVALATGVLVVMTMVIHRLHSSLSGLGGAELSVPPLVARAERVGRGFRDLDEQAREVSRRLPPP